MFSLKIIEVDNHKLSLDDISEYSERFKIILENKNQMESNLYRFIITRLIDNVLLASMSTFNEWEFLKTPSTLY